MTPAILPLPDLILCRLPASAHPQSSKRTIRTSFRCAVALTLLFVGGAWNSPPKPYEILVPNGSYVVSRTDDPKTPEVNEAAIQSRGTGGYENELLKTALYRTINGVFMSIQERSPTCDDRKLWRSTFVNHPETAPYRPGGYQITLARKIYGEYRVVAADQFPVLYSAPGPPAGQ